MANIHVCEPEIWENERHQVSIGHKAFCEPDYVAIYSNDHSMTVDDGYDLNLFVSQLSSQIDKHGFIHTY